MAPGMGDLGGMPRRITTILSDRRLRSRKVPTRVTLASQMHPDENRWAGSAGLTVSIMTESTGAPGYPTASYPGGAGLAEPPARPTTVTLAFYAWLLLTALSLISLIVVLSSPIWDQAVAAGVRQADTNGVTIDVSSLVTTVKVSAVVGYLVAAALYLLFAFKMRAGRNWARVVLTIIGILAALGAVLPTYRSVTVQGTTYTVATYGIHWINLALTVAAVVLMYLAASNTYFAASKAFRQSRR